MPAVLVALFALIGFTSATTPAATLSIFSAETPFLAAAQIASTETFDEFPSSTSFTTPAVVIDDVVYSTEPCLLIVQLACWAITSPGVSEPNRFGSNATGTDVLSFGFGNFVNAIGFYFIAGGTVNGIPTAQQQLLIHETNGQTSTIDIGPIGPTTQYFGFVSSIGIYDVVVNTIGDNQFNVQYDNVSHSRVEVPEPQTLWLLVSSFLALLVARNSASLRRIGAFRRNGRT